MYYHLRTIMIMAAPDKIVNPIHPSVVDKVDPDFARIYNAYQGILSAATF